ncbi:UTP--glucose-1-phosphate uridylyltransferase [Myxosarcina sp. GI1]|uniref:UTP--glucose-1-phosphate uridylyltransferase n=1 Tax=Myxosarcina sp. GI1 TaxID=1541065 RepID=UPI000566A2EB|nr:UTP--glucose-1-phosphate uridylyltransferase [Myxosarcina sp. GI1]
MVSANKVTKAVIPAAGFGTRMYPITKAIKKEFLPIVDRDGRAKPIILAIVEEAISAGIEEIAIITQESDRDLFLDFFQSQPSPELWQKLSSENREYSQYLQKLGDRITILTQSKPEGFGHAVFCAKDWVNNEPFLLLLGDHVYISETEVSCSRQLVDVYKRVNKSVVGITIMSDEIIQKAGCIGGTWQEDKSLLNITQIYEKPSLEYAREHLHVAGMNEKEFLGIFGLYILEPKIFDFLASEIANNERFKGEFQLTTCLDKLQSEVGAIGYLVKGQPYDTGMPLFYRQTMIDFYN